METRERIEATCPDCRGPLTKIQHNDLYEFRCLVGHNYSPKSILAAHSEAQERALWGAVVALEEALKLVQAVSPSLPAELVEILNVQADKKLRQAAEIRQILENLETFQLD